MNRAKDKATIDRQWLKAMSEVDRQVELKASHKVLSVIFGNTEVVMNRIKMNLKSSLTKD